jgi:hypothetical protein
MMVSVVAVIVMPMVAIMVVSVMAVIVVSGVDPMVPVVVMQVVVAMWPALPANAYRVGWRDRVTLYGDRPCVLCAQQLDRRRAHRVHRGRHSLVVRLGRTPCSATTTQAQGRISPSNTDGRTQALSHSA